MAQAPHQPVSTTPEASLPTSGILPPSPALRGISRILLALTGGLSIASVVAQWLAPKHALTLSAALLIVATATLLILLCLRLPLQNVLAIAVAGIAFPAIVCLALPQLASNANEAGGPLVFGAAVFLCATTARFVAEALLRPWRTHTVYGWLLAALTSVVSSVLLYSNALPGTYFPFWLIALVTLGLHFATALWFIDKRRITLPPSRSGLCLWISLSIAAMLVTPITSADICSLLAMLFNVVIVAIAWRNTTLGNPPR
jgi:hypothetical protein